jgi:MFS family permease
LTETTSGGALFNAENLPKVVVLAGGTGLHAVNVFIGGTLMPSVVADIGGLDLFAWTTTLFIVASIIASSFAAVRPFGIGPRGNYLLAAAMFGLGSVLCGLSPSIVVLLVGRTVQGFGAGLLVAMTYTMIRLVFPQPLRTRALGLNSVIWGAATLVGPAIGGLFAEFDAWRWAFFSLVPFAVLVAALAARVIPNRSDEEGLARIPMSQIALIVVAMLAISLASAIVADLFLSSVLVAVAAAALAAVVLLERTSSRRLLPTGTFRFGTTIATLFAIMVLMQFTITSDVFVPYFLQTLHGQSPLIAGYLVALMAVGWSTGSVALSGWAGRRAQRLVELGPVLVFTGAIGLAIFVGRLNLEANLVIVLPIAIALVVMGFGMGILWPHLMGRIFEAAPPGEKDVTTAAITMAQLFASGLGAAIGGLIVNTVGLARATGPAHVLPPAFWLYGLFALVPPLGIVLTQRLIRAERLRSS